MPQVTYDQLTEIKELVAGIDLKKVTKISDPEVEFYLTDNVSLVMYLTKRHRFRHNNVTVTMAMAVNDDVGFKAIKQSLLEIYKGECGYKTSHREIK